MNNQTITIKGVKYTVKFGWSSVRRLAEIWDLKKPSEVDKRIQKIDFKAKELGFDDIDILRDLFFSGLTSNDDEIDLKPNDLMDYLMFENPPALKMLMDCYINSLPKPETNPNVNPDQRKKK